MSSMSLIVSHWISKFSHLEHVILLLIKFVIIKLFHENKKLRHLKSFNGKLNHDVLLNPYLKVFIHGKGQWKDKNVCDFSLYT